MNESIYYLVDELHTAINGDKRIRFHYTGYDGHGRARSARRRVVRREPLCPALGRRELLPHRLRQRLFPRSATSAWTRSPICAPPETGAKGAKAFAALDMSAYTSAHFGMFSGTPENIRLECRDTLAGAVIDRFGTDTMLIPSHEGYFTVTVPVAVSAPFFGWLCSFGGDIKLLAPESAVDALQGASPEVRRSVSDLILFLPRISHKNFLQGGVNMSGCIIPEGYTPRLNVYETQRAIEFIKRSFQKNLGSALNLKRVSAPLFVRTDTGLNDDLNGIERPVSFDVPAVDGAECQVVQSLAKWKRWALREYNFYEGKAATRT